MFYSLDLVSYLKSFGTEPTQRFVEPKVVSLPPPAISVARETIRDSTTHISLPLQVHDVLELGVSTSSSAINRNQVWIKGSLLTIRNRDFERTMAEAIKSDVMRSLGFNLRPTDCDLKLLGMRLLSSTPPSSASTVESSTVVLEPSMQSLLAAEQQQCVASIAIQVQSRYTGGEITFKAAQTPASSSLNQSTTQPHLPTYECDLSVSSNPTYEWSTLLLAWTDPYVLSQRALTSGCQLRLEYGLFLTSTRPSGRQGSRLLSVVQAIATCGQQQVAVPLPEITPFGILLVSTSCDSGTYLSRTHESLKSRLANGDLRLLDAIVAANEALPVNERCSIKLVTVKLRYKSYAPTSSAKRTGPGYMVPSASRVHIGQRYYHGDDDEGENSYDDEDEDEDEGDYDDED